MRHRILVYGSLLVGAVAGRSYLGAEEAGANTLHPPACVPTEHMPIVGLGAKFPSRMPVIKPSGRYSMPVAHLVPCYLRDTLAAIGGR